MVLMHRTKIQGHRLPRDKPSTYTCKDWPGNLKISIIIQQNPLFSSELLIFSNNSRS